MRDARPFPTDDSERAWLAALPRQSAPHPGAEDRLVAALRQEGFFAPRRRWLRTGSHLAAASILLAIGAFAGVHYAERHSVEVMLARDDLTPQEAVLLVQRAGSDYVKATQQAAVLAPEDPVAAEVASQVLVGSAQAVARTHLDAGVAPQLIALLGNPSSAPAPRTPTIVRY